MVIKEGFFYIIKDTIRITVVSSNHKAKDYHDG
jgi:hypothetical protein